MKQKIKLKKINKLSIKYSQKENQNGKTLF